MDMKNKKISAILETKKHCNFEPLEKGNVYNVPIVVSNGITTYAKNVDTLFNMPFF